MTPKRNSQVAKCLRFLKNHTGKYVPSHIIFEAQARITSETLARKLREYSKGNNPLITKNYYQTNGGPKIATYSANTQHKEVNYSC